VRTDRATLASFVLMVALPGSAVTAYYTGLAADQYTATARFTVSELHARPMSLDDAAGAAQEGGALGSLAADAVSTFTHVTASYVESSAMITALSREIDVTGMFRVPEADFWARLPEDAPAEQVARYWRDRVGASIDGTSGIVTVELRAFRPEDALTLARGVIAESEALVNTLSERQKADALARAEAEASASEARLTETIAALSAFRDEARMLDPQQQATETVQMMSALTTERIRLESQLRVLSEMVDPQATRLQTLRTRLDKVREDLARLQDSLAADATADANIAATLGRFEELEIRRRFATRLYGMAQTRLIETQIDQARQSVFLNVFDPPRLPEQAQFPRRIAFPVLACTALFIGWSILALIWASVRDHRMG
jgi:capsular polysaccharide transport system permease protein